MAVNRLDVDWLLGRRFVADLRVLSVGSSEKKDDPSRKVKLAINGDEAEISFGELQVLIETGFIVEADGSEFGRKH